MSDSPKIAALVLNYNGQEHNPVCLASLANQTYENLTTYFIDNASSDGSVEWVEEHFPAVRIIRNAGNWGYARGNNAGIKVALDDGADLIWILNNDIEVDSECAARLSAFIDENLHVGIAGPAIYYFDRRSELSPFGGWVDFEKAEIHDVTELAEFEKAASRDRYISGAAMMVRWDVFEEEGWFDENFFMYCEDVDFCLRASQEEYEFAVVPEAKVFHKMLPPDDNMLSPFTAYQSLRSGMFFWRKHLGWWAFHRRFCGGHLGKWLQHLEKPASSEREEDVQKSIVDALWYYVGRCREPLNRPESPAWFNRFVRRRPWLIGELLSLRWGRLLSGVFSK